MKRITFITGHYGSGKSEFSLNLAIIKHMTMLIDLDIVNPYFRSRELESILNQNQIKLVASTLKNSLGSDLPFISGDSFQPFLNKNIKAIYDLGGDHVGARLLRQYDEFTNDEEVDLLLCINVFREETATSEKILKMIADIESSAGIRISGLINNSNLLRDTTIDDVLYGEKIIKEVSAFTNLEILYTGIKTDIIDHSIELAGEVIPLQLYLRKKWL